MKKQKIEKVPHPALVYSSTATSGVVGAKSHEKFPPLEGETFRAGNVIRFNIPEKGYLDPDELCIEFRTKIFPGANNTQDILPDTANIFYPIRPSLLPRYEHRLKMCQFVPGIQCLFSRVRLLSGQTVLEDIQDYNVLYRMLLDCTTSREWRCGEGFMNEGVYDPNDFYQRVANANWHAYNQGTDLKVPEGHVYLVKPLLGLLACGKYIPVKYMHALTLELHLAQNAECLWSSTSVDDAVVLDGNPRNVFGHTTYDDAYREFDPTQGYGMGHATPLPSGDFITDAYNTLGVAGSTSIRTDFPQAYYELDRCFIHTTTVYPEEQFDHSMKTQIANGMVHLRHTTWSTHVKRVHSCTKTSVSFQESVHSLKSVLACMRNSPTINAIDSDFCFPANGIQRYQWRIGSEFIPTQAVECGEGAGLALAELKKTLGLRGPDSRLMADFLTEENFLPAALPHQLNSADFSELRRGTSQPSSFYMALDTEKSRGQISGFDTASNSNDIELHMDLRPHTSLVPITVPDAAPSDFYEDGAVTNGSVRRFKGAIAGTDFQPSKKRVIITQQHPGTQGNKGRFAQQAFYWGDKFIFSAWDSSTLDNTNPQLAHVGAISGAPEGFMTDMGVTYTLNKGNTRVLPVTSPFDPAEWHGVYSVTSKGPQFALVYLFAHVDQVLILDSFGTSKVVR